MNQSSYRQQKLLIYFVTIFVLVVGYFLRWQWQDKPFEVPKNGSISLVATIKSEPKISHDRQVLQIGDAKVYTNLFPKYSVGDKLKIEGKVDDLGRIFNPKVEKIGQVSSIKYYLSSIRNRISSNIQSLLPSREATLVVGSVLGVDNISQEFREQLVNTGTIHVVVVSGQNLALVAGMFLAMASVLGRRKSLVLATLAVFLYAMLTGFAPPVVRASLMVLLTTMAVFLGRETSGVWSLFLAALIILFVWPSAIFEISFQLTFAATSGILTMGQFLSKTFGRVTNFMGPVNSFPPASAFSNQKSIGNQVNNVELRAVGSLSSVATHKIPMILGGFFVDNAAIAISAYTFTAPIIFWHFGRLTLVAPLVNVLVAEAVFPIMVFGFLTAAASLVFMPLAQVFAWFAYVPALYFTSVVSLFAEYGF